MTASSIIRNVRIALFATLVTLGFSAFSQTALSPVKPRFSNPYGVSDSDWTKYLNKTNLLSEKVDIQSFLNYVVFNNDGDFHDMDYFLDYVKGKIKKDKMELIYRVGKGTITTTAEISKYYADLQPKYNQYYLDFKSRRDEIIQSGHWKAPSTGPFPTPSNCGSPCTNPGFESGTGFWDYYTGTACASSTSDPCSIVAGFSSSQHVIQTVGGFDPVVGAALPVVPPGGGSSSLMLGDGPVTGGYASRACISFTVSAANANFTYRYACVLQDPVSGHTDPERPYFNVHLRDGAGNLITCGEYMVMAKPPIVGFTLAPGTTDVYYRPWTTVLVPLSSYIGQCVTIQFTSSDCAQGGHYGYAYIDGDCDPLAILSSSPSICGGGSVTLNAPAGAAGYAWTNTAGGTTGIVGSTTNSSCTVNAAGTYQVVITSDAGPSCTTILTITIGSSPTSPVASFTNTTVCAGTPMSFTDTSTPAGSITSWSWDFNNDGVPDATTQNPSYTFAAGGTYPVTLTISNGPCNAVITQNVTVTAGTPPTITPAGPFCTSAASVNLSGTPAGGTWTGTGITNPALGTFNPASATVGSNTITYTVSGGCGGSTTATIVVNPNPSTTVNSTTTCPGVASTLTAGGATTYLWSTGATTNPVSVSPATTTSYTVTGTTAGCTSSAVATVTIGGSLSPTVNSPTICAGGTATLTAAGGTTYLWNTGATANPLSVTPGTTTSYTVTATSGGCSGTVVATVTVNPLPVLVITNPPAVCSPGTVDITAAAVTAGSTGGGALSYWTDPAATIALAAPAAVATSGTYYIESTTAGGCTDIDPVTVTINPLPVSNAGPDISFCSGSTGNIGVASTAGENYSWAATTGLSSSAISNPTVTLTTGAASTTSTYTVTTTISATGCTSTDMVNVTVNPVPALVITNPAPVCSPLTADITAAAVTAGSTISGSILSYWNDAAATIAMASPSAVAASGTYYILADAGGGCTDLQPVTVTINPLPVSNAGPDVTICTGGTASLGVPPNAGDTYAWALATGLSSSSIADPTVSLTNPGTTSTTTTYTVTTTTTATGCTSTDVVIVTVDAVATANAGSPQNACVGGTITLAGAVGGSATGGTWSGGTGTYSPNNTTLNAVYTPSAAEYAAGTVTLTLTTNDPTGPCTFASSNVTFSFFPSPNVVFVVDDPDGCPIHCATFTDNTTVPGGGSIVAWSWDFGDGGNDVLQDPTHCFPDNTTPASQFYNVTLTATTSQGCVSSLMIPSFIQVFPEPVADFIPNPQPASVLDPVVTLSNSSSPDVTSWWYYFGDGDSIGPGVSSPVHTYPDIASQTYFATLYVQNSYGCVDTTVKPIEIGPEFTFYIPNAFTPNGDGVNDYFYGQGIGIIKYDLMIFDRWGNLIFEGNDLNKMWDGKANGGDEIAQQDVYVWKVHLTDVFQKKHSYIGTVTLVK
ncbi:MAG: PKD domain-containing protein [Bacteroidia bacterium]